MECKCPSLLSGKCHHGDLNDSELKGYCPLVKRIDELEKSLDKVTDAAALALTHIFNIPDVTLASRIHDELEPTIKEAEELID